MGVDVGGDRLGRVCKTISWLVVSKQVKSLTRQKVARELPQSGQQLFFSDTVVVLRRNHPSGKQAFLLEVSST